MMIPMRLTNPIKFSRQVTISKDSVLINGVEVRPSSAGYSRVTGQLISKTNRQGMVCFKFVITIGLVICFSIKVDQSLNYRGV